MNICQQDALNGRCVWRERLPQDTKISDQLGKVLDKLLQDYVKERYQSADEVLQTLDTTFIPPLPKKGAW